MGFHYQEELIINGSIDNRIRGRTVLKINFTNQTSSLITLEGNPCRDLAGSLWKFRNPSCQGADAPGSQCDFIPESCEGEVGKITYANKRSAPTLPLKEHFSRLLDDDQEDPPMALEPTLELEWFSPTHGQIEIDCQKMKVELVEMIWAMSAEEALEQSSHVDETRREVYAATAEEVTEFHEEMELFNAFFVDDGTPHELKRQCQVIVQQFETSWAEELKDRQHLHCDLLELQARMVGAFVSYTKEGAFVKVAEAVRLLGGVLPFIDRVFTSAQTLSDPSAELALLHELRDGVVALRDELAQG